MKRFPTTVLAIAILLAVLRPAGAATFPPSRLGHPIMRTFAPQPYAAAGQNWSVTEDAAGVAHFGNSPGVVSFDGATWRMTRSDRFTPVTRAVATGPDGRIYAGSRGDLGWLQPHPSGSYTYVSLLNQLAEADRDFQEVFQITAHGDAVCFSTSTRLLIWRNQRFTSVPRAVSRLDSVGGVLYLQAANQPLERLEGDRPVTASADPVFLRDSVRYLGPAAAGRLLVATGKSGLFHLEPATGRLTPWTTAIDALLQTKQIYRALRLADGSVAIAFTAVTGGGLALVGGQGEFLLYLDEASGLPNGLVYGLGASREGGLWLCLDYGVAYLDWPAGVTTFGRAQGLEKGLVTCVRRHGDDLYVGNTQGLFRLVAGEAPRRNAQFERVATGGVYALHADADGLFAVADHQLLQLTPGGFVSVFPLPSLAYTMIRSQRDPAVRWVGHDSGLRALRRTAAGWRDEGLVPELRGTVRTVVEAPDGNLWAAIDSQGFFRVTITVPPGGASPATTARVERLAVPDEEQVKRSRARVGSWAGETYFTLGNTQAFLHYDAAAGRLAPHPALPALPRSDGINAVSQSRENPAQFWFLSVADDGREGPGSTGIHRVANGRRTALPHRIFDAAGRVSVIFEDMADGVLWIGGSESLLRVETARAFPSATGLNVLVRTPGLQEGQVLPPAQNAADFDFVAPAAGTRPGVEYQTRLTGYETAWSEWSSHQKRSYTNLSEGRYRFEVRARDSDQTLSPPSGLGFTILPPWWRTWWAFGGYATLFGMSLLGFARLRNRTLQRKNERLEKIVATRTDDLRRQNQELARLHQLELDEKIIARLTAEKAQLDVLRYQLNPHFLFNSLASIRGQIPPTLGTARDTLDRLADFCRLTLHGRESEERTTIGEELAMLRAYLDIEQTRLGELLSVEFAIDPALDAEPLPRLLLLPLVENALKYGHATSVDLLAVRISARRVAASDPAAAGNTALVFEIANTGEWVERGSRPGIPSTGIGHDNLRDRLRRHYPGAHEFTHSVADGWVRVQLVLKSPLTTA